MEHSLCSGQASGQREDSLLAELHLLSRDALHVLFDASSQELSVVGCLLVRLAPVSGEGVHHSTMSREARHMCVQQSMNVVESSSTFDDVRSQDVAGRYAVTRNVLRVLNRTPRAGLLSALSLWTTRCIKSE